MAGIYTGRRLADVLGRSIHMAGHDSARRDFLKLIGAAAAAALAPHGVRYDASANAAIAYDPAASFDVTVSEVELRRTAAGRQLMARVYQPKGAGPFPTMLDLHGGAW